jgi:hypothetical protein
MTISTEKRNLILSAILSGTPIQDRTDIGWKSVSDEFALRIIAGGGGEFLRVKPDMASFFGFEYTRPTNLDGDKYYVKVLTATGKSNLVTFARSDDAEELYLKIVGQIKP